MWAPAAQSAVAPFIAPVNVDASASAARMMSFGQAIATCSRKYVAFGGRATRAEFWWFALFSVLVFVGLGIVELLLEAAAQSRAPGAVLTLAAAVGVGAGAVVVTQAGEHDAVDPL